MYKKVIEYTDYNGTDRKETFMFNLSKAELVEMELSKDGTLTSYIQRIIETLDQPTLIKLFKELILKAYGEKSPDGKYFRKVDDNGNSLSAKFAQTEAFSNLYMELVNDDDAAAEFVNNIIPKDMAEELAKLPKDENGIPIIENAKL